MQNKFTLISLFLTTTVFAGCGHNNEIVKWHSLSEQKIHGVSGIAAVDHEHFLVVHDNKKTAEPRLSIVTWLNGNVPALTPISWCEKTNFPIDLEAITAIPNHPTEYLVLESKGNISHIKFASHNTCKTLTQFELPTLTAKSNIESLALHCFSTQCVLAWAERGDDKEAAKLSWAKFDVDKNSVAAPTQKPFEFFASYPNENRRSISDMAVDADGVVWASAASDPGDDGFFKSALYKLGAFTETNGDVTWQAETDISPSERYDSENIKIEGLAFMQNGLIMGTDDENKGAKIAVRSAN
jgi:hypothetical protein